MHGKPTWAAPTSIAASSGLQEPSKKALDLNAETARVRRLLYDHRAESSSGGRLMAAIM